MTCVAQVDYLHGSENTMPPVYNDVTAMAVSAAGWPASWLKPAVSPTCEQPTGAVVPPPSQTAGTPGHVTGGRYSLPAVLSDGGANSRDSWSSTSSNPICPAAPSVQHQYNYPPQYSHQQLQYRQVYDWPAHHHHRHTWSQVETNQSMCRQVYPQHAQQQQSQQVYRRAESGQCQQRPAASSTVHPYHHQQLYQTTQRHGLPAVARMTHEPVQVYTPTTYNVALTKNNQQPAVGPQHHHHQNGTPHPPVWTGDTNVDCQSRPCFGGTTPTGQLLQPTMLSYQQPHRGASSAWDTTVDHAGTATTPTPQDAQQQPVSELHVSFNDASLSPSNLNLLWSPDPCYDRLSDWFTA